MDQVRCSLCGQFFNPKHGHSCTLENYQSSSLPATPVTNQFHGNPTNVSSAFQLLSISDDSEENTANSSAVPVETSQDLTSRAEDSRSNTSNHFPSEIADCSIGETDDYPSVLTAPEIDQFAGPSGNRVQHLRIEERNSFVCDQCSRGFSDNLNPRRFQVHTGEEHFLCNQCGRAFADISSLGRYRPTYTEEMPFVCCVCERAFADIPSLGRHVRTHTEEKLYVCYHCGKPFMDTSSLRQHLWTHLG